MAQKYDDSMVHYLPEDDQRHTTTVLYIKSY